MNYGQRAVNYESYQNQKKKEEKNAWVFEKNEQQERKKDFKPKKEKGPEKTHGLNF